MAITTTTNRVQFDGDDSTTDFAFTFPISVTSELRVYLDATLQTETTHYTLSATNNDYSSGGTCAFNTAPATGETVTLERIIPSTSTLDLSPGDTLPAETVEDAIDRLTMQFQQLEDKLNRAITIPNIDPTTLDMELVAQASRTSGQGIMFDGDGQPTVGSFSGSTISAFMATVNDDTDANSALATLMPSVATAVDYTILDAGPSIVRVTTGASNITVTLPDAGTNGDRLILIMPLVIGTGNIIVAPAGSDTINAVGSSQTYSMSGQDYSAPIMLISDGTSNWHMPVLTTYVAS